MCVCVIYALYSKRKNHGLHIALCNNIKPIHPAWHFKQRDFSPAVNPGRKRPMYAVGHPHPTCAAPVGRSPWRISAFDAGTGVSSIRNKGERERYIYVININLYYVYYINIICKYYNVSSIQCIMYVYCMIYFSISYLVWLSMIIMMMTYAPVI